MNINFWGFGGCLGLSLLRFRKIFRYQICLGMTRVFQFRDSSGARSQVRGDQLN